VGQAISRLIRLLLALLLLIAPVGAEAADLAVVVSPDNPIDDIPWKELVKIFKLEKQYWRGNEKVYLVLRESGSKEKAVVLEKVYQTSDEGLKKMWLAKMYREEITSFPRVLNSNEAVIRFVSQVPTAISVIDDSYRDARVKTLRINGALPGEDGYPLKVN
jgi:ABC-type phosphate transport system substrate-binding protein